MVWKSTPDDTKTVVIKVLVAPGKLHLGDVVGQPQVAPGATTTVYADVFNDGSVDANARVDFTVYGKTDSRTISAIPPASSKRVGYSFVMGATDASVTVGAFGEA